MTSAPTSRAVVNSWRIFLPFFTLCLSTACTVVNRERESLGGEDRPIRRAAASLVNTPPRTGSGHTRTRKPRTVFRKNRAGYALRRVTGATLGSATRGWEGVAPHPDRCFESLYDSKQGGCGGPSDQRHEPGLPIAHTWMRIDFTASIRLLSVPNPAENHHSVSLDHYTT